METQTSRLTLSSSEPAPLLARITANPLLLSEASSDLFRSSIEYLAAHEILSADRGEFASDDFWPTDPNDWMHYYRPYNVVDGVLQVPVQGVLLHRFPYALGGWATGYAYIDKAIERGISDANVRAIALVVDSPGGEVAGCFELCDKIFGWRGEKPIQAFAEDSAYSAAYAIASSASKITVTRSGGTGSVGVVTSHVDYSAALERNGIKITFIFAGAHKVDGNSYEPLADGVKDRIQTRIDKLYGVFVSTVARNRGMGEDAVRGTEALCYDATESLEIGFADAIGSLEDETARFAEEMNDTTETDEMTDKTQIDPVAQAAAVEAATASGFAAGSTAERARTRAIIGSDAAKTRPSAAIKMALNDKLAALDAATVIEMLADVPEEKAEAQTPAPKGTTPFNAAMDGTQNPQVGSDANANANEGQSEASQILAASRATTGLGKKPTARH